MIEIYMPEISILTNYGGVCDKCGDEVHEDILIVCGDPLEREDCFLWVTWFPVECKACKSGGYIIRVWKTLEVSQELEALR